MSYRALKHLLGETSLERKCRFIFGGGILMLITASFYWYGSQSEKMVLDLAVNLGCLWGQTVCDGLDWQWCCLMLGDGRETYVVVTPNRSHIVAPMDFVLEQLQKRLPEENTSMLLYDMLKGKAFGKAKAKAYLHVG